MGGYSEKCQLCGKWFVLRFALKQHINDKHNLTITEYAKMATAKGMKE